MRCATAWSTWPTPRRRSPPGVVPDGLALNYTHLTQAEMRKNGVFDYINGSYADKGLYYYARTGEGIQYYIYSNKKIDKADLSGLKLRIAPIYRDFFQKPAPPWCRSHRARSTPHSSAAWSTATAGR